MDGARSALPVAEPASTAPRTEAWSARDLLWLGAAALLLFATGIGLGGWPALFSLGMLLTYSVVMGLVYQALRN